MLMSVGTLYLVNTMSCTANLQMQLGPQLHVTQYEWPQPNFKLGITVECPYCGGKTEIIGGWGSYPTLTGKVRRYMCKNCARTFNPAKIPYWHDKVEEFVWKLTQMTIKDRVVVNALAKMWEVPETTLRTLITAIKDFLAINLEIIKQLQERLSEPDTVKHSDLRTIFYDEGFIKLLGANGFILFTFAADGTPINVAIEPRRDAQTICRYFVQAMTQLGGIDVIVGDGAKTIFEEEASLQFSWNWHCNWLVYGYPQLPRVIWDKNDFILDIFEDLIYKPFMGYWSTIPDKFWIILSNALEGENHHRLLKAFVLYFHSIGRIFPSPAFES